MKKIRSEDIGRKHEKDKLRGIGRKHEKDKVRGQR